MFFLRMMFWLSIVILLIPAGPEPTTTTADAGDHTVTVDGAIGAAAATVSDVAGFCERNREVCDTGSVAFDVFVAKAENAARLAYRLVAGRGSDVTDTAGPRPRDASYRWDGSPTSSDTLLPSDREPAWQGPTGEEI